MTSHDVKQDEIKVNVLSSEVEPVFIEGQAEAKTFLELENELAALEARIEEAEALEQKLKDEQEELDKKRREFQEKFLENQQLAATLETRQFEIQQREAEEKTNFANFKLAELDRLKDELEKTLDGKRRQIESQKLSLEKELDRKREEIDKVYMTIEQNLAKRKDQVEKEVAALREERLKELEVEYKRENKAVQERLAKYREDIEAIINEKQNVVDQALAEIKQERAQFEADKKALQKEEEALRKKESDLIGRENELRMEQELLRSDRDMLGERVSREIQSRLEEKDNESMQLRESQRSLMERVTYLQKEIDRRDQSLLRLGNRTADDLLREIEESKNEINELRAELQLRPTQDVVTLLEEKSRRYDDLHQEYLVASRKVQALELAEHRYEVSVAQLQIERQKYEVELKRSEAIQLQIKKYEEEVNRLKALHEQPEEVKARRGVIEKPYFEKEAFVKLQELDEMQWINFIDEACQRSGMKFNKRLLLAFHTALKTSEYSPLTVLAGVSGTGKSELPRLYSRFGGLYYLPLPVQPDWDSPQSLFGYFNSVDNRFNATPLIRSMVQFQSETNERTEATSLKDGVLLVLLDEMNLAHVELYFSELLSKLETRRGETSAVHVDIDLGAGMDKFNVELSQNVLWVGTMNEDETTKSLSDKVIDRGNLLSFPRPRKFEDRKSKTLLKASKKLPLAIWQGWLDNQVDIDEELVTFKEALEEINIYLEVVGRALGHRVWQSVKNYIGHHPFVIVAKNKNDEDELKEAIRGAFEEALVHKVMPKLRGIEVEGTAYSQCLNPIKNKLVEVAPGLVHDFELAVSNAYGVFIWRSAKYLEASEEEIKAAEIVNEEVVEDKI